jgi:hypothetical protein
LNEKQAKNKHFPAEKKGFSSQVSSEPFSKKHCTERHEKAPSGSDAVRNPVRRVDFDSLMIPPELREVIQSWEKLPEAVRAGILAMVKAASKSGGWVFLCASDARGTIARHLTLAMPFVDHNQKPRPGSSELRRWRGSVVDLRSAGAVDVLFRQPIWRPVSRLQSSSIVRAAVTSNRVSLTWAADRVGGSL